MKRIIVLGGTGLLGTPLVKKLKDIKDNVYSIGNLSKADFQIDLLDTFDTFKFLTVLKPALIINLVALTNVDKNEANIQKAYLINIKTIENVVNWIIKESVHSHLIHISTDQVYDNLGYSKENEINLTNIYALTKYMSESVVKQVQATVLRTNFFGKSQTKDRISLSDWLVDAFKNRRKIDLFTDIYFNPLHFSTLIEMIIKIIDAPVGGVFNLGSRDGLNKMEFARYLAKTLNLDDSNASNSLSSEYGFKACRPKNMLMNITNFEQVFYIKLPTLKEEIERLKNDYR